jgi:kynurenine formamidase
MNPKDMILAVDFDGTCVTHEFPQVGREIGAAPYLKAIADHGVKLILFTMRSDQKDKNDRLGRKMETSVLQDAIDWFKKHDIKLWAANENPEQSSWTSSPKVYAHKYIDDAAHGCPLVNDSAARPYVDWQLVGPQLLKWAGIKLADYVEARRH